MPSKILSCPQLCSATSGAGARAFHPAWCQAHVASVPANHSRLLSQPATNHIINAAGLVLLFETGLVLFDLADIVDGGPNTPTGTVIHQNRGEWLLAPVSTYNMHSALCTF